VSVALYAGALESMAEGYRRLLEYTSLVFCIPVVAYSAMPFFTSAIGAFKRGINMDVPVALAISITFITSLVATVTGTGEVYYDSVVMFTFLLLGARYVDGRLRARFDMSSNVLAALPDTAVRLVESGRETVRVCDLETGDRVWVNEGERLPVDGILQSASAILDEATLSGESVPVTRKRLSGLWAGTINCGAGIELLASAPAGKSRIADIAALADKAHLTRAPQAVLADRVAAIFIPAVLLLASGTFLAWQFFDPGRAFVAAIAVLIVSCPCALSLATPAALTAAMTKLRQSGLVLTTSRALHEAATVNRALIDKTGTLTLHQPRIESVTLLDETLPEAFCRSLAGALQAHSSHPYASAFPLVGDDIPITRPEAVAGEGIRGFWGTREVRMGNGAFCGHKGARDAAVYLAVDNVPKARFVLTDEIRRDAQAALDTLKSLGIEPMIVSGDTADRCETLAKRLGVNYLARQTPESKLAYLNTRRAAGDTILMLGDGINDVPVLAGADVSAAVVEASDLVKSSVDVLLLTRRLAPVAELIRVARKTRAIIRQNLLWAAAYNLTAVPIAALGFMPPWLAALGMASSSTLVMFNASRILKEG
jgi:Cu2+-exporting ATPase